jgi:polysaccharide biosynthesis transport protein
MQSSRISEEVEKRQQGETLELLDPASLPQTPTEPKRHQLIGAGIAGGIILGLFLAGAREAKDASLKNLKDVRAYTQLMILGSIPLLENDLVVRRRKRLAWLAWSTACLVGVIIMTGSVFWYYSTKV